jgi:phosphotriesterase-related protein
MAETAEVVTVMAPQIERTKQQGVTALVEASTVGVGRRADLDLAVSLSTSFPIIVPTGSYREPWITPFVSSATDAELEAWMVRELTVRMDEADYRAGWIKLSAGDDGITPLEARVLRAATRAGVRTGSVIGSHTIKGRVVMDQLDIIEDEGYRADRFIWIHAQREEDINVTLAVAERGTWIEYDHVGRSDDDEVAESVLRLLEAGLANQMLISQDLGWYDPAMPGGGTPRPYTHLVDVFLPLLKQRGVTAETLIQLTQDNPFRAYARPA